jgi:hypothetical protein
MPNTSATVTLQDELDIAMSYGDLRPALTVPGFENKVILTAANDVMNAICAVSFPHKWNEFLVTPFYTNSLQQDYAIVNPDGSSITNMSWLERGTAVDINNTAIPKPFRYVECGRQLPQQTGSVYNSGTLNPLCLFNWFNNYELYYGTWGAGTVGTSSFGNNPGPGSVYIPPTGYSISNAVWSLGQTTFTLNAIPGGLTTGSSLQVTGVFPVTYNNTYSVVSVSGLTVTVSGPVSNPGAYQSGGILGNGDMSMPQNPTTQIQDANGNLLVLTTYGTEGTAAPVEPANSPAGVTVSGTGANTVWTVVDPNGVGFRLVPTPPPTGVVWQYRLVYQAKPVRFTKLSQTLDPLPDDMEPHFRAGFIAQCYKFSSEKAIAAKFAPMWQLWLQSLNEMRAKEDRELEENMFTPDRGIMGGVRSRNSFFGPQWPYNYPSR